MTGIKDRVERSIFAKIFLSLLLVSIVPVALLGSITYYAAELERGLILQDMGDAKESVSVITENAKDNQDKYAAEMVSDIEGSITEVNNELNTEEATIDSLLERGLITEEGAKEMRGAHLREEGSVQEINFTIQRSLKDFEDNWELTSTVIERDIQDAVVLQQTRSADLRRRTTYIVGLIFLVTGVGVLGVSLIMTRHTVGPIQKLTEGVKEMGKGDFNRSIDVESRDEIGVLGENINLMVAEIGSRNQEIKKVRDHLENIFESTRDTILVFDSEGTIIDANTAALEFCGLTREEVIGRKCYETTHDRTSPCEGIVCAKKDIFENGQPIRDVIHEHIDKDGNKRAMDITASPMRDESGNIIAVVEVARDITERILSEEALKESEERYRGLVEHISDAIIGLDTDGFFNAWNQGAEEVFGYTRDEVLGKPHSLIVPKDLEDICRTRLGEAILIGHIKETETYRLRKDGRTIPVDMSLTSLKDKTGEHMGFVSVLRDISERKMTEEALKSSEKRYRGLIENMHEFVMELDLDGSIQFVNEPFFMSTGYTREEVIGSDFFSFVHPDDHAGTMNKCEAVHCDRQPIRNCEFRFRKKDGTYLNLVANGDPVFDEGGNIASILQVSFDITKRKRAEEELKKAKEELEIKVVERTEELVLANDSLFNVNERLVQEVRERKEAQEQIKASLKEKEVLLKEVHHRVKNNLQVISSLLYLQSKSTNDPMALELLNESQHRVKTMALIHEKLYQSEDLANINFKDYARGLTINLIRSYATGKKIDAKFDLEDIYLDVDAAIPCGLIINELVTNALQHAFSGTSEGEIRVSMHKRDGKVELTVGDSGTGLPDDLEIGKAGTLGLKLVNMFNKQLGGDLDIRRADGTEFRITFEKD